MATLRVRLRMRFICEMLRAELYEIQVEAATRGPASQAAGKRVKLASKELPFS
jgi:hypothetical protein